MTRSLRERPPAPDGIAFYGGNFSNFASSPIVLLDPFRRGYSCHYPTVEHRFQAMKATTLDDHLRIAGMPRPYSAKAAGRLVPLRPDWKDVKVDVMLEALRAKFEIPHFRAALLSTGRRYIYEDSPTDAQWGLWNARAGSWTGLNLLGEALMQVRSEISGDAAAAAAGAG